MEGLLVMADISGYTAFVAGTEQEHSQEILAELMEAISRSFGGKLTIDQVEGDALCCTTDRTDVGVIDWLRETFRVFHGRLRDIRSATTCPCRACATVQSLGLKFVVHRGTFSRYEVAGRVQLHGNDVNLIHRLLKNTVPGHEYLLATAPALAAWPESARAEFVAAPQRYDLGDVDASYLDLRPIREAVWDEERPKVDPATAKLRSTARFPGTPEEVFRHITDPNLRKIWMGVPRVDFFAGARGSLVGAEYHCIHGENQKAVFKVLDCSAPREITMQMDFPMVGNVWRTDRVEAEGPSTTRVDTAVSWKTSGLKAPFVDFMVARMLRKYGADYDKRVADLLQDAARARV
ncbi:MAG TPA: DUF2652 domain-containing protein [Candidatus Limnocylindria bacterium]|jgi:uncharacterized protein YndB with AHSA1/START domain/class 3 adenylate cyclase|nr:DUF2652 domain-containing protein [Candidatus Limnocylindria bacterium]